MRFRQRLFPMRPGAAWRRAGVIAPMGRRDERFLPPVIFG